MTKPFTYISLFSSAGVGCHGFKIHGFECIATNEILAKRLKIQLYNKTCKYETGYIDGDITKYEIKQRLFDEIERWKRDHKIKNPDVIIATPPCQGMSVANHKKNNELRRNSLVVESIKITSEVKPKYFVFENVRNFLKTICTDIDGVEKPIESAIKESLGGLYNILFRIVNFKDFGSNSSRTRTLVIGVRKDLLNISPYDIFPKRQSAKTLKELIGDLPPLKEMGEISADIYHSYREYDKRMLPWIENLKEGESAFQNKDENRIPHIVKDGKMIVNQSKNGDKYARWYWDREGPCIHTRNDILASQNTIHPSDNRVFSIRELMRMMSIPDSFRWTNLELDELNKLSLVQKKAFLRKEELNIRHCLGEAVPTGILKSIAENIKNTLMKVILSQSEVNKLISSLNLKDPENLRIFIENEYDKLGVENIFLIAEHSNSARQESSAYFTRKDIAFNVIKDLPDFATKKCIRILEPSVGVGNFIPSLIEKYREKDKIVIDLVDIDNNSLDILKTILKKLGPPRNFKFNFINYDYLLWENSIKYDLVVGNPPYMKLTNKTELLSRYKFQFTNSDTNNLFSFFIEKSLSMGSFISFIVPKSLINAPEFNKTRSLLNKLDVLKISDYGEKGFNGVLIETISFLIKNSCKTKAKNVTIESYINNSYSSKDKQYIFSDAFPYWLIYRDIEFDRIASQMQFDIFVSFRDRQITKTLTKPKGKYRVLKSRNVGNIEVKDIPGYDCYIDEINNLAVSKFLNRKEVVMVPNLTYYPRAAFLPKNSITDGSVALLMLKNGYRKPSEQDLKYYSTKEFEYFYRVARNLGTRSLNIDNNSVFFFGLLKTTE